MCLDFQHFSVCGKQLRSKDRKERYNKEGQPQQASLPLQGPDEGALGMGTEGLEDGGGGAWDGPSCVAVCESPPPSPSALSGALIWELNHISKLTALHL